MWLAAAAPRLPAMPWFPSAIAHAFRLRRRARRGLAAQVARLGGWLAALLCALPAGAHDATELSLEELAAEPVFSGSKFPRRIADVPGAVSVITADDIRAHGWRSFDEVLGALRGVFVSNDRNYYYLSARGFGRPGEYNPRFLFLLDGQRLNDDVLGQAPVGRDLPIDVGMIERVEFISGPGSASFGSGAFIGTVNIVSREPASMPGWRALAGAGSNGMREARASWGGSLADGTADLVLSAGRYRSQGARLHFDELEGIDGSNATSAPGRDAERADNLHARLRAGATTFTLAANEREKQVPTPAYRTIYADPGFETGERRVLLGAETGWNAAPDLRLSLLGGWMSMRGSGHYPYYSPVSGDPVVVAQGWGNDRGNLELRADWTGLANHRIAGGIELKRNFRRVQSVIGPLQGRERNDPGSLAGVYAEDGWRFAEHWQLDLGLRADSYFNDGGTQISPRAALIWQPTQTTSVKLVGSRAFRTASQFEEIFLPQVLQGTPRQFAPETIRDTELIVEHYASNNWRSQASFWTYDASRLIGTRKEAFGGADITGEGTRRGHGIDLETEFALDGGTRLRASAAWQTLRSTWGSPTAAPYSAGPFQASAAADGGPIVGLMPASFPRGGTPNAPRLQGGMQLSHPLGMGEARGAVELRAIGSRLGPDGAPVAGRAIVNVNLSALPLGRRTTLDVGAFNLFDRRSYDVASADNVGYDGEQLRRIPQDGLMLRAQLRVAF
ncbi:TonB-dependent receptor plug domain-containing protein [Derxia gummosa]|uniref:TonB-dependent receptor plug domain-containing protein n=1 Tax=Derxia gummosa DSM 723 TaxID=1121388 RepID=A0A8B6XCG8_9BURK|nr:TonB-dependent receptor [Derxia gummosa]